MPSGTVQKRDEATFELLPEGWYLAKLLEVTDKPVGDSIKLKWKWQIVAPEQFATTASGRARWAFGECWSDLDQSDKCVWRRWHEALVERPVGIDERIDTEDVKGFFAYIKIGHRHYVDKNGETQWVDEVAQESYEKDGVTKWAASPESVQPSTFVPPENELPRERVAASPNGTPQPVADDPWATPAPARQEPDF